MSENHELSIINTQPTNTKPLNIQPIKITEAIEPDWNYLTTATRILIKSYVSEKEECVGCIWDCTQCCLACCTWIGNITGFYPLDYQFEQRFEIIDKSETNKNVHIGKLKESSNWLCRQFLKESRKFEMKIKKFTDSYRKETGIISEYDVPPL